MYLRTVALIQYFWLEVVGKSGNIAEYSTTLVRNTNSFPKEKTWDFVAFTKKLNCVNCDARTTCKNSSGVKPDSG